MWFLPLDMGRGKKLMVGLSFASLLALGGFGLACAAKPEAKSPQQLGVAPELPTSSVDEVETAEPSDFQEFSEEFLSQLKLGEAQVERFIDPTRGVLFATNTGAFIRVFQYHQLSELLSSADYRQDLVGVDVGCSASSAPGLRPFEQAVPRETCEDEPAAPEFNCSKGTFRPGELKRLVEAMLEHDLVEPSAGRALLARVNQVEPQITHFVYNHAAHVGYFFGKVGGVWRLLWVRAITPCSA